MTRLPRTAAMAVAALALAVPAAAPAADTRTPDREFSSTGKAINPQATGDPEDPTTFEDFPFTIANNHRNGSINVHIDWTNPADDWDLYVYRKQGTELQTVGQSAGGAPQNEENAVTESQGIPVAPGQYVVRVVNYAAVLADFTGTVKFGEFVPGNEIPIAKLQTKKRVKQGKKVRLDASASHDPDGSIKNYAFDLDGNGSMEVNNGDKPVLLRKLKPGTHHVAVRVTDDKGLRAFANRTVVVTKKKKGKNK